MIFEKGDLIMRRSKLAKSLAGVGIIISGTQYCDHAGYSTVRVLWMNTGTYIDEYCDGLELLKARQEE